MTYKALYTKVLLQLLPTQSESIIVNETDSSIKRAKVISVGSEVKQDVTETEPFNIVFFYLRDAKKLSLDNQEFYLIDCHDILLIEN